ncbi:MAG: DUF2231 domain-containing protein [Candidatus Sumerlaeaceae bacterium]
MNLRHLMQGRGVGHPIHPLLIHFPIAAFLLSFLCDLVAMVHDPGGIAARLSFGLLIIGLITGALAALFGLADFTSIRRDSEVKRLATQHAMLNTVVLGIYAGSVLIRYNEEGISIISFLFSCIAITTLMYSGYLGGEMVYSHGVAVGRHRRKTELPDETIVVEKGATDFTSVCPMDEIGDGESRRVEIDGTLLVVVRQGGDWFAFQEFCTHRHGPLSAGTYADAEVVCPWHRSCFDMRTGAVKNGPAKVPIKVFPVRVSAEGMVEVRVSP